MENLLVPIVSKSDLIEGISLTVEDDVEAIIITPVGKTCCEESNSITVPITTITTVELASITFEKTNTTSIWSHLTTTTSYNKFYGCTTSYILEYPFAYQFQDEILQNIKDYTKTYVYLQPINGVFNTNRKIQVNDRYFNKAVVYNDQQSSGMLNLFPKPKNNMSEYISYPKYNLDSKSILYTNSDNFYQFNTFWSVVKDKTLPLFNQSCESMSIDKEVNQENMDYTNMAFRKATLRAKDIKVRLILDNTNEIHLVSQFIVQNSQISYK